MNTINKFSAFELESPDSNVLTPIELNCEKSPGDIYDGLTTTEQNDQIFQNYVSLSKFKNSNFDNSASFCNNNNSPENNMNISVKSIHNNTSKNNFDYNNKNIDVTPSKNNINKEKEYKGKDSIENYTPISTLCNYYLQSESNMKTGKKNKYKKENNDCKKNIIDYLNTPKNDTKNEKKEFFEVKLNEKNRSKLNNIIKSIKKESKNHSFIHNNNNNKRKGKNSRPKSYSNERNLSCKKFTVKFVNPYCKQSAIEEIKNIYHFTVNKDKNKNPLSDIIQKIKNEKTKEKKKKNVNLIPHSKIDLTINNQKEININYKPFLTEKKKRNLSFDPNKKRNNYICTTINNSNRTKGLYSQYKKIDTNNKKVNLKLIGKIPSNKKKYSQSFINNKNNNYKKNNSYNKYKRNSSFQNNKISKTNTYTKLTSYTSNNNSSTNSNYLPQSKRTIPKYYIIKSPIQNSNKSQRQLNKNRSFYLSKSKRKSPSSYIRCSTNVNTTSNNSNIVTTTGNNIYKTEYTNETIPTSFRLNSENDRIKKIFFYSNKIYKDYKEKGKIPIKQYNQKVNNINKKIESTYISTRNNSKNSNTKKNNLSFTKINSTRIKNN